MRDRIRLLLLSTNRPGMEELLEWMDNSGYYTSPCSGGNHLAKEGGLAEHSLNVMQQLMNAAAVFAPDLPKESLIICSLLHDLGKCGDFGKAGYVPNRLKSGKLSESKPYETNKELSPVDHEIRSVCIAERYICLSEDEELAILWHNGLYGNFKYQISGKETPLYLLLHFADMWASRVIEKEK